MNNKIILLIVVNLIISTSVYAKKKMYKWVDENGNVSYSDKVPPKQIKKERREISSNGVVVEKIDRAKTIDEINADRETKRKILAAEKLAKKQEVQRKNIIKSYTNEAEIIRLKNERLDSLGKNIDLANKNLIFQKTSKDQLLSIAADNERDGKEISKALKSRIDIVEDKIKYQLQFIKAKTNEKKEVEEKFDNDLKVYRQARKGIN